MQHKNTNYCNENEPKQKDIRTIAMNHKTQPNAAQKYKGSDKPAGQKFATN